MDWQQWTGPSQASLHGQALEAIGYRGGDGGQLLGKGIFVPGIRGTWAEDRGPMVAQGP